MQDHEFVNVVAHDLKSPLGAVRGFLDLLQAAGPLNPRQQHYVERMLLGLHHMEHLVLNLLNYTRIESGAALQLEELDLRDLAQQGIAMLESTAVARNITIQFEQPKRPVKLLGEERMLSQVVLNLLSNAIKYNREGGQIHVLVRTGSEKGRSDDAVLRVQDTGAGIAPRDIPRIFERFYRSVDMIEQRIEGTGLGLAIVNAIVQRHRGHIEVESTLGVGSVFTVTLPRRFHEADGDAQVQDSPLRARDRQEGMRRLDNEMSSEERDAVDDSVQEARHLTDSDSHGDQV